MKVEPGMIFERLDEWKSTWEAVSYSINTDWKAKLIGFTPNHNPYMPDWKVGQISEYRNLENDSLYKCICSKSYHFKNLYEKLTGN